jgi:hypothetical protein
MLGWNCSDNFHTFSVCMTRAAVYLTKPAPQSSPRVLPWVQNCPVFSVCPPIACSLLLLSGSLFHFLVQPCSEAAGLPSLDVPVRQLHAMHFFGRWKRSLDQPMRDSSFSPFLSFFLWWLLSYGPWSSASRSLDPKPYNPNLVSLTPPFYGGLQTGKR